MRKLRIAFMLAGALVAASAGPLPAQEDAPPTALIIIDIQEFYFPGGRVPLVAPEAATANAARLLEQARRTKRLVVHVGHNASAGKGFHGDVAPREGEPVVMKDEVNAFLGTDLHARLQIAGVRRIVFCGMQTHMCVEAAARAAHDQGYEVVVAGDACATRDLEYGGTVVPAAQVHAATLATLNKTYARVIDTAAAIALF